MRRRFGQHFLRDREVVGELIRRIAPRSGETLLEIGPGDGALTEHLLQSGAAVTAVEIDRDLADGLLRRFQTTFAGQFKLIVGDVLKEDLDELLKNGLRTVGNLPYNISAPLLLKLSQTHSREMWLMMQKEVASRLCASPGDSDYGRLTVSARLNYAARAEMQVPPSAFSPPPKVDSTVLRLTRRDSPLLPPPLLPALLSAAFQSRRKTLSNGLAAFHVNWQSADIAPTRRPQTLSPEEFIRLSQNATLKQ